jgi:hypothetical protein
MDADGSLDPCELPAIALPILEDEADLVLGARIPAARGAWPLHARLANRALAAEVRRRAGLRLRDIGPMRAARREPLIGLRLADRRFAWPLEMVLRAVDAGWRVEELEIPYLARAAGRPKVTGSLLGSVRAVRDMSRALAG